MMTIRLLFTFRNSTGRAVQGVSMFICCCCCFVYLFVFGNNPIQKQKSFEFLGIIYSHALTQLAVTSNKSTCTECLNALTFTSVRKCANECLDEQNHPTLRVH